MKEDSGVSMKNEKGVTLIELLAVLVLVTLIATLIMTTFTISFKYNVSETKKVKMQQEANYIVSLILQEHRTTEAYQLEITSDRKLVFKECENEEGFLVCEDECKIIGNDFYYSLSNNPGIIHPKIKDYSTTLTVEDPANNKLKVAVETNFTRYKSTTN